MQVCEDALEREKVVAYLGRNMHARIEGIVREIRCANGKGKSTDGSAFLPWNALCHDGLYTQIRHFLSDMDVLE
jgi:hypothetical protein